MISGERGVLQKRGDTLSLGTLSDLALKAKNTLQPLNRGAVHVAPGYVLLTEYSIKNAVKYVSYQKKREKVHVGKLRVPGEALSSIRVIENQDAYDEAQKLYSDAVTRTDRLTSPYINGLKFVEPDRLKEIDEELEPLRAKATDINEAMIAMGSKMRVKIEIYKFVVDTTDRRNAVRLGQLIHEKLTNLRAIYTEKRSNAFRIEMDNVRNLERVVVGKQSDLIRLAIQATEKQRDRMIAHYGGRKGTFALREEHGGRIPDFDYTAIDAAIAYFGASLKFS